MLGYRYEDIQRFGGTLNKVLEGKCGKEREELLDIWDFFEGLLGEGYIKE